jgi:hypothetical protein
MATEVTYKLTTDDLAAFEQFHRKHRSSGKSFATDWVGWLLSGLLGGLIWLVNRPRWAPHETVGALALLLAGAFLGAVAVFGLFYYLGRVVVGAQEAYYKKNPSILARRQLTIDAEGVEVTQKFHEHFNRWAAITKVGVTKTHIFLYSSSEGGDIVPRAAFADDAAFDEFVRLVREYMSADTTSKFADRPSAPTETYHAKDRFDDRR